MCVHVTVDLRQSHCKFWRVGALDYYSRSSYSIGSYSYSTVLHGARMYTVVNTGTVQNSIQVPVQVLGNTMGELTSKLSSPMVIP